MHLSVSMLMRDLPHEPERQPKFRRFILEDWNPLSGHGKQRIIYAPNPAMRIVHKRIRMHLLDRCPPSPYATGSVRGGSTLVNAKRHKGNRFFLLYDIRSAYPSVDLEKLIWCLAQCDPRAVSTGDWYCEVEEVLTRFVMAEEGGLMTGAPSSPAWFNLYAGVLIDIPLGAYCLKHGLTYTRYLDDITISSLKPIGHRVNGKRKSRKIRDGIRAIIESSGMAIHDEKALAHDIMRGPVVINGIGMDRDGRMFVPRHFFHRVKNALRSALRTAGAYPPPAIVNGLMSVIRAVTRRYVFATRGQQKLLDLHRKWKWRQDLIRNATRKATKKSKPKKARR